MTPVNRLLYWIRERESIRLKKEAGDPKPWTEDPILQRYRFCNVRRMDDKVSQWLLENWYKPYKDHHNILIACVLARFFNLPSTLEAIGFPETWNAEKTRRKLRLMKKRGLQIFNGAYMVRGNDGVDKVACVINHSIQPLVKKPPEIDASSMRKTWEAIECRRGFGSFMAGQVVADLRWAMTGTWSDRNSWAPMGPGSKRGLSRLYNRPLDTKWSQQEFLEYLKEVVTTCYSQLPIELSRRLEMMDWQNCLCEFDKYMRTLLGEGRPKQLYQGI